MSVIEIVSLALVGLFLLVAVVRLFRKPLKLALRVVLNSALGLGVLWLLNSTAPVTGLTLGVNWFNALTVGVLGLPGLGLLLLVKWVLVWYIGRKASLYSVQQSVCSFNRELILHIDHLKQAQWQFFFPDQRKVFLNSSAVDRDFSVSRPMAIALIFFQTGDPISVTVFNIYVVRPAADGFLKSMVVKVDRFSSF